MIQNLFIGFLTLVLLAACKSEGIKHDSKRADLDIQYEKLVLNNGLELVLHVDKSDPIVAIDLAVHVGSARETEGKTGFAHLFEHLLFMDSENLGYGGLDEMNTRIGGEGTNGFTTHDMTQYFQAVPSDALEKVIWAEADKLGFFINTVTENVVANEKQVVKNEKRQRVDNVPYGHRWYVVNKTLYPEDHPYNWQVIGSLEDLDDARLTDVQAFYKRWYVPNNVTLTISGDFDSAKAKVLVEKYFGEIPRGETIEAFAPRPGVLDDNKFLFHEDTFAKVAQLGLIWPTAEKYHPDSYALDILTTYLSEGKRAPLNEVLIDEVKVTSQISMFYDAKEIAGEVYLIVNANPNEDLDTIPPAIELAFKRFEKNGISETDLDRIKAGLEVEFYQQIQSALGKAIQLGEYNLFTGDPGFIKEDIKRMKGVSRADLTRVYNHYIKDKYRIASSFVPKGRLDLALNQSERAEVVEEKIVEGAENEINFDPHARVFTPTASRFDRKKEPGFGAAYELSTPEIWRDSYDNGVEVFGIENVETPLVFFSLFLDAGRERGSADKPALANLTADLMNKGTAGKTTAELEDAIKSLGSNIEIHASRFGTYVEGKTLSRNFDATMRLVSEMLLEPRWDNDEFQLLLRSKTNMLEQAAGNANYIARQEAAKLRYPPGHVFHYQDYGIIDKLDTVSLGDLKTFYNQFYKPGRAQLRVVGDIKSDEVKLGVARLRNEWNGSSTPGESLPQARDVKSAKIYFYDLAGSKQSVLNISRPSMSAKNADLAKVQAVNFLLGGIYTSDLMTELRVNRGYTYGIRSGFYPSLDRGLFSIGSSVRSNVTKESIGLIRDIVQRYGPEFTEEKLTILKSALLRGQALKNETLSDKLAMLGEVSVFGYPDDYKSINAEQIEALTLPQVKSLVKKYLRPDTWNYVVVGDAESQISRLKELGLGEPVLLNQ